MPNLAKWTAYPNSQDDSEGCFVFRRKLSTQIVWEWSMFKIKDNYGLFKLSHDKTFALKCNVALVLKMYCFCFKYLEEQRN